MMHYSQQKFIPHKYEKPSRHPPTPHWNTRCRFHTLSPHFSLWCREWRREGCHRSNAAPQKRGRLQMLIAYTFPQKEQYHIWDSHSRRTKKKHEKAACDTCRSDCQGFNVAWMATDSHYLWKWLHYWAELELVVAYVGKKGCMALKVQWQHCEVLFLRLPHSGCLCPRLSNCLYMWTKKYPDGENQHKVRCRSKPLNPDVSDLTEPTLQPR